MLILRIVGRHNTDLSQILVDYQAIMPLLQCVQEPELHLKRISIATLSDICKNSKQVSQAVIDATGIDIVLPYLIHADTNLKAQVCAFIAQVMKHSDDYVKIILPKNKTLSVLVKYLSHDDEQVKRNATIALQVVAKYSEDVSLNKCNHC